MRLLLILSLGLLVGVLVALAEVARGQTAGSKGQNLLGRLRNQKLDEEQRECSWTNKVAQAKQFECCSVTDRALHVEAASATMNMELLNASLALKCIAELNQNLIGLKFKFPISCCKLAPMVGVCKQANYDQKKLDAMVKRSFTSYERKQLAKSQQECPRDQEHCCQVSDGLSRSLLMPIKDAHPNQRLTKKDLMRHRFFFNTDFFQQVFMCAEGLFLNIIQGNFFVLPDICCNLPLIAIFCRKTRPSKKPPTKPSKKPPTKPSKKPPAKPSKKPPAKPSKKPPTKPSKKPPTTPSEKPTQVPTKEPGPSGQSTKRMTLTTTMAPLPMPTTAAPKESTPSPGKPSSEKPSSEKPSSEKPGRGLSKHKKRKKPPVQKPKPNKMKPTGRPKAKTTGKPGSEDEEGGSTAEQDNTTTVAPDEEQKDASVAERGLMKPPRFG